MKELKEVHPGAENNQRLGVFPGHHDVVRSHPIGNVVARKRRGRGQALRFAALPGHHVDFGVAVILRSEGELFAIR